KRWITGWRIISAPSTDNQYYVFPSTAIPAGKTLVLYTGSGTNGAGKRYWGASGPRWDNGGDKAILKNGAGTTMDVCQYAGGGTTAYC
ncbi:MAG: lamin tail domain-containing protein, partial [Myxococcaceae bacterium]